RINGLPVEAEPTGTLLVVFNEDRPGVIGYIGKLLGDLGINIAGMTCGRTEAGSTATTLVNIDSAPSEEAMAKLAEMPLIKRVEVVTFKPNTNTHHPKRTAPRRALFFRPHSPP